MHHIKLIIFGTVLALVIIFGVVFWDDLKFNQQEISNMPLPPSPVFDLQQGGTVNHSQSSSSDADSDVDADAADSADQDEDSMDDDQE